MQPCRMASRLDESQHLAFRENAFSQTRKSSQIRLCEERSARVIANQLFDGVAAVTNEHREDLLGDGKDLPERFRREAIVEEPSFM